MAMEIVKVIEEAHESSITSIAYNKVRKEIFSSADGDKVIKAWDAKTGQFLRTQQGHKGSITCLTYATSCKLLFSGSIDSTVGIWTDKGVNLQMAPVGGPVFSLAWDSKQRCLAVGGSGVVTIYKVDLLEARKTTQQQRSVASGLRDNTVLDAPQILRRMFVPLKGPDLGHTDVVSSIIITDGGKIISGGFDKCICMYDYDKLDKPKEAFQRIRKCHTAAIVSMAYDAYNNCLVTGSIDGSMKVWSMEGRLLDKFENINDQPVHVAYVPPTNMYWATGRFGRMVAYDPRAPSNVTPFVKESNGLDRYKVEHMYAPPGTDILLGSTKQRQLVMWQHNQTGAYRIFRKHEDWVESVIVVRTSGSEQGGQTNPPEGSMGHAVASSDGGAGAGMDTNAAEMVAHEVYSCGADGKVLRWQLDIEQNCDIYNCVEEYQVHDKNIYAILYAPKLDCLVTGGEDSTIQMHYLNGVVPTFNDVPLPTSFNDHEGRVTGLALLAGGSVLASISFDKTLRTWDLLTMKPLGVVPNAHDTPLQCIEYCMERGELATCAMGNKVKIWDVSRPSAVKHVLTLDHADTDGAPEEGGSPTGSKKKTDMQWLTRSDLAGLPKAPPPVVECIQNANKDTPEVTQVRWVAYRHCWVTAADDDMIRLWSHDGHKLSQFTYSGGSCQCLFVDNINRLLVASMLDKKSYVYDLDDPMPLARYTGHNDVVRAVAYVPESDCYLTASWDRSLRLWYRPGDPRKASTAAAGQEGNAPNMLLLEYDEDEETFVSEYEKLHPLEVPRALTEASQMQILKAIGVLDDDDAPNKKGKRHHRNKLPEAELGLDAPPPDPPGSLGAKLDDLGKNLLHEINVIAGGKGGRGGGDEERMSARSSTGQGNAAGGRKGAGASGAMGASRFGAARR